MAATASSAAANTSTTSTVSLAGGPGGVEAYEDMFKEITRKLYGEETGHGLHTLGTPLATLATTGPTLPEGERSFTTLAAGNSIDFANELNQNKDHLFGLAALMQNGFSQPPLLSQNKTSSPGMSHDDGNRWNNQVAAPDNCPELLQWNVSQPTTSKPSNSKAIKKESETKRSSQSGNSSMNSATKRYTCSTCPYSTDRRDLYTRHENIHKTEKPFHCYVCAKQFNRADHVKKHFLRMHRELQYDINKTRRTVSSRSPASTAPPAQPANTPVVSVAVASATSMTPLYYDQNQQPQHSQTGSYNGPSPALTISDLMPTHDLVHQQQQQQQQQVHPPLNGHSGSEQQLQVKKIKQEKQQQPSSSLGSASSNSGTPNKKKGDKNLNFHCCYCSWKGADNWGLKRHLNTHTKPYVCILCDYKAARSERLVTHVYKVHNKKACSKCSFLADDHAQFLVHQSEAHPADNRVRQGANSHGNNHNQSSVLRAIGNSNATNSTTTLASGNGQTMALFGNGFTHVPLEPAWRPATTSSNIQKRGAERLFQYMEADGSDPEDYQKQLQMTALSRSARNTVAQDFHNAGGGVTTSTKQDVGATKAKQSTEPEPAEIASSLFANKGYQQKFMKDLEEFIVQRLITGSSSLDQQQPQQQPPPMDSMDKSSSINTPPPAKRRRCSSHDKENYRHGKAVTQRLPMKIATDWSATDRGQMNAQMREIFQMITTHYGEQMVQDTETEKKKKKKTDSLEHLERILKNNHELTISIKDNEAGGSVLAGCIKYNNGDSGLDDEEEEEEEEDVSDKAGPNPEKLDCFKSKRKQFVPRKIGTESRNNFAIWNSIRDKHLSRMMSQKKSCRACVREQKSLNIPYHSVTSLVLHMKWRHWQKKKECDSCGHKFKLPYQLMLHRRSKHN